MDPTNTYRDPVTYRDPAIIRGVLGYLIEAADNDDKAPVVDVRDMFADDAHTPDTVEKMLYDLQVFGAIRRTGEYDRRRPAAARDKRRLHITTLGRHWFEGTQPQPLGGTP
jgi:hypothetical protein